MPVMRVREGSGSHASRGLAAGPERADREVRSAGAQPLARAVGCGGYAYAARELSFLRDGEGDGGGERGGVSLAEEGDLPVVAAQAEPAVDGGGAETEVVAELGPGEAEALAVEQDGESQATPDAGPVAGWDEAELGVEAASGKPHDGVAVLPDLEDGVAMGEPQHEGGVEGDAEREGRAFGGRSRGGCRQGAGRWRVGRSGQEPGAPGG